MNNSSLASEFLTRSFRDLSDCKKAFEEGDLLGSLRRMYELIENISFSMLVLYGFYYRGPHKAQFLELLRSKASEKENKLIDELELLEQRLYALLLVEESSLKMYSILARNIDVKALIKKVEDLFELANTVFDEFHS
ncbi:hypothetical protein SUSAZ_04295 [Sulfolobus acidocaldarius SUSAZ]|nr:hypothetical protein SUSAZ_04295 [Sulfolobus acidocaldarius SUSAZ]